MLVLINGRYFEVVNEDPYWDWVKKGNFDHEWKAYDKSLKEDHTFIDLGAWIGSHSMYASKIVKRIVAVEPDPVAFEILCKNLYLLDPRSETVILRDAVGSKEEIITLGSGWLGASTTRRNLAAGGGIGAAVPEHSFKTTTKTLREIAKPYPDPLYVKIDIEGQEEEVFKDWQFFQERKPTVMVEMHSWWWVDESEVRRNFQKISETYKVVSKVRDGLYLMEM